MVSQCNDQTMLTCLLPRQYTSCCQKISVNKKNHIFLMGYCSKKLHLQYYLEMLWSETGYFGLLGKNLILFIILLYIIERQRFIGLKQWIWEDHNETNVSLGRFSYQKV